MRPLSIPSPRRRPWLPGALALLAAAAPVQPRAAEGAEPGVPTRLEYRSALGAYQAHTDPPAQPWREANDRVERRGGWRAYAREAAEAPPSAVVPGAAAPAPTPAAADAHRGHHGAARP